MAITIQAQPSANTFYSVGNPIEFLISSDHSALSNFKLDVKIYYDPAGANTLIYNGKCDVLPSTTQVLFDAAPILKSKIVENIANLRTSATGLKNESTRLTTFRIVCQEYFGTIPALSGSTATSNTILFYNGSLKNLDWVNNKLNYYRLDSATGADTLNQRLLSAFANYAPATDATITASPQTYFGGSYNVRKINYNQLLQIMFLWQGTTGSRIGQFAFFKSDFTLDFSNSKTVASAQNVTSYNIGTAALLAQGSPPAITSIDKYFYFCIKNGTYQITGCYLYELDWSPCGRFDTYEIHWLNALGGWDSWVFNKRSYHETLMQRKAYNPTSLPISGSSIVHNSYDIKGRNFIVSTKEKYLLNSDYLKQWELSGLQDLLSSPLVYWNSPDYGFVNIAIDAPETHVHKLNNIDKLFNLSFSFEIDNQDTRQMP